MARNISMSTTGPRINRVLDFSGTPRSRPVFSGDTAHLSTGSRKQGRLMRILIAEDSLTQAVDLRRRLEALGHEVVVAGDGLQAWKLIQARPERLVITDWMMPEMSGLELCRKIRTELSSRYIYTI